MVGLGNVDNTTDAGKPISTATATELALKATKHNPTFTGTVTLPVAIETANDNTAATTAFVVKKMNDLVNGAPAALNTPQELATSLNNDTSIATTIANGLGARYTKIETDSLLNNKQNTIADGGLTIAKNIRIASRFGW